MLKKTHEHFEFLKFIYKNYLKYTYNNNITIPNTYRLIVTNRIKTFSIWMYSNIFYPTIMAFNNLYTISHINISNSNCVIPRS